MQDRRQMLSTLAKATGAVVLLPRLTACSKNSKTGAASSDAMLPIPMTKPDAWDPIAFNRTRGNQGAIPKSYWPDINGPEGQLKHLGKHLPFQPDLDPAIVPEGHIAIMWGDPSKGYAKHPNAKKGPANNNEGHWYNWIKIRKASPGEAEESKSTYASWPATDPSDAGKYVAFGDDSVESDDGKNTVYLAALPSGLQSGDTVRIYAHCLTHGEYVDFMTLA